MSERSRRELTQRIVAAAMRDDRIVGVLDYGSSSEGRADEFSDVDLALYIRDRDFDDFERGWQDWAAQFGTLLFGYVGKYAHPWAMFPRWRSRCASISICTGSRASRH
jgi:hypothetical protein